MGSNPNWGSDFTEFPMGSINISFHMCKSFSHSLTWVIPCLRVDFATGISKLANRVSQRISVLVD